MFNARFRIAPPAPPAPPVPEPPKAPAPAAVARAVGLFEIRSDEEAKLYGKALGRYYGRKGGRPKKTDQPPEAAGTGSVFALPGDAGSEARS